MLRDSLTVRFPPVPTPWVPAALLAVISASAALLLLAGIAAFALPGLRRPAGSPSRSCSSSSLPSSTCGKQTGVGHWYHLPLLRHIS